MIKALKKWAVGIAGSYAKDYLTVDNITQWLLEWVNSILEKAMTSVDSERLAKICETSNNVSVLCGTLSRAIADKKITEEEANNILADVKNVIGSSGVTNEMIAARIDTAIKAIKEKIG